MIKLDVFVVSQTNLWMSLSPESFSFRVCLVFQLHFMQMLMKQKAFSCHLQKLLNFLSCGDTDNFTCQEWLLIKPSGTGLNMSNNTQSWRRIQDWYMSQVFPFGKNFQNCTVLAATTKLSKMLEENLANFSVFCIGTGLRVDNNKFAGEF